MELSLCGARRTNFNPADHGAGRHSQHHRYRFGDIFRGNHPTRIGGPGFPRGTRELRIDAARHDGTYPYVVVAVVEHQRLGESVEAEFRRVIGGAPAEGVAGGQAGDVDDESAAARGETGQGLMSAIESAIQVEIDVEVPLLRRHLPHLAEAPLTAVVHQDVAPTEPLCTNS